MTNPCCLRIPQLGRNQSGYTWHTALHSIFNMMIAIRPWQVPLPIDNNLMPRELDLQATPTAAPPKPHEMHTWHLQISTPR